MKKTIIIESQFLLSYNNPHNNITIGGTQRYSLELGTLIREMGYEVIFLAKSKLNFEKEFEGFGKVVSFNSMFGRLGNSNFSKRVYNYAKKVNAALVIYSDLQISYKKSYTKSVAIQHGIGWDNPFSNIILKWIEQHRYIKATLKHDRVICVDTNYINWIRSKSKKYFLNQDKVVYVPNFADESKFIPSAVNAESTKPRLLFCRRLENRRGIDVFVKMCLELIEEGYDILPVFAIEKNGKAELYKRFPKLMEVDHELYSPNFDEVVNLYNNSFLSFVPSLWSEGTSLSAIESIMCGCPVLVSDVGGLGNIVINNFNGFILPPTVESFKSKTKELLSNKSQRNELRNNCLLLREPFSLKRWKKEVEKIITEVLKG